MKEVKYLVLGGGPSGLTFLRSMLDKGNTDIFLLEKEDSAGGLCRSIDVDGAPLDIGGGHFLDVRRPEVTEFAFRFLPKEEWDFYERDSRISIGEYMIGHPFEANIWQFPDEIQNEYLESIKAAGCNNGSPCPERFVDWIRWKLGDKIADDYMLPYNSKMFSDDLNDLGTYWLSKLPDVDYEDTLKSCQNKHPYGKQPGHAQFYYPHEYGYGELFIRMADSMKEYIKYNARVTKLDVKNRIVTLADGETIKAEVIVTTIPYQSIDDISGLSDSSMRGIENLKSTSVEIRYFSESLDTKAQWIYIPDPDISYHRILVRSNFTPNGRGYWTETRSERIQPANDGSLYRYVNEYAYPLNTIGKVEIMASLLDELKANKIFGLGRWGEHDHYNSDLVMAKAMELSLRFNE